MKLNLIVFVIAVFFISACSNNSTTEQETEKELTEQTVVQNEVEKETKPEVNLPPKDVEFSWFYGMCEYTGTYDANKISKKQLDNTLIWLINGNGTGKSFSIFKIQDFEHIDRAAVEKKFNETLTKLKTIDFVNTPYFVDIKEKRIKEVERLKLLSLIEIDSYTNPGVLNKDTYSKEQCSEYVEALIAGGDKLLAMRKKMAEESKNAGNKSAWDRYIKETKSDKELDFARVHVSTFGWWNCVNGSIERVDPSGIHDNEFKKLFKNITEICEVP